MRNSVPLLAACLASTLCFAAPAAAQYYNDGPPVPPDGAAPTLQLPAMGDDGQFETPNKHLTSAETIWHLRAALNVAALNCRDVGSVNAVADYNAMLTQHGRVLAQANTGVDAVYRAKFGVRAVAMRETDMTRTYNFFAQPPAQAEFCPVAEAILAEIADIDDASMPSYAEARLREVEAPFLAFYARYAAYRVAMARWQGRDGAPVALATVAVAPLGPVIRR